MKEANKNLLWWDHFIDNKEKQNFIENLLLRISTNVSTSTIGWPNEEKLPVASNES